VTPDHNCASETIGRDVIARARLSIDITRRPGV